MDTLERAEGLLRETEAKLRELLSTAATSGDYTSVVRLAAWARTVSELTNGLPIEAMSPAVARSSSPQRSGRNRITAPIVRGTLKNAPRAYPVFFRKDDQLIRLAWSKREKKEYRHKAPNAVLKALAKAMAEKGAEGRVFSTEDLLPLRDSMGSEVPNYQAYVGISFLKQTGLIDQHGRQGYSIPRLTEFKEAIESVWKKLPETAKA